MQSATRLLVWLCVCLHLAQCQLAEGQQCVTNNAKTGTCKPIVNCPAAIADLQQRIPPKICGFAGSTGASVVCCPSGNAAQTTTTTTTTARTTTRTTRRPVATTPKPVNTTPRRTGAVGEISAIKCKEYGEYVYVKVASVVALSDDAFTRRTECAMDADVSIVGGKETKRKEFPHMALVGYDSSDGVVYKCGGSLISENFVLTAAHCLFDRETNNYAGHVRLGEYDQAESSSSSRQDIRVSEYIKHPDYKPPSKYNDIALLRLERNAKLNDFVRPACLPTADRIDVPKAVASGWGRTSFTGDGSDILLKVTLDFYTPRQCNDSYEVDRKLNQGIISSQICAGSFNDSKDACQGDSGGPLQISNTNNVYCTYTVVGVTSFGKACGIINQPGVYTKVFSYLQWIERLVWPNV